MNNNLLRWNPFLEHLSGYLSRRFGTVLHHLEAAEATQAALYGQATAGTGTMTSRQKSHLSSRTECHPKQQQHANGACPQPRPNPLKSQV